MRTTVLQPGGDDRKLNRRVMPVRDDHLPRWQAPPRRAQPVVVPFPRQGFRAAPRRLCGILALEQAQLSTSALKVVVSKRSKLNTTDCGPALSLRSQRRV